ncbi:MAG: hypothetical protein M9936_29835 [Caldilinea sp.]|nr:hypothetical protein [Caldilinea sp.]MCB0058964.1 hypothetical protein [Caldilineaceae bacterium]MCB0039103.1 hypothetical protein [Caldilinea sp.]MCB0051265.1 hypothetical protein [Caldilinea sp.]MCB0069388.1 hypothetical protein [Caldilineaceae bacterium]
MNVDAERVATDEATPTPLPDSPPQTEVKLAAEGAMSTVESGNLGEPSQTGESGESGETGGGETGKETAAAKTRHFHPVSMTNYVAESGQALTGLAGASELTRQLLTGVGIVPTCTNLCSSQREVVLALMEARQQAAAAERMAVDAQDRALAVLQSSLVTLRGVERTLFRDDGVLIALGLNEELPGTDGAFVDRARFIVAAAERDPYATILAGAAFSAERIAEIAVEVDVAEQAIAARQAAHNAAVIATRVRDEAFSELRRLMQQLRVQVNSVLHRHPEVERPVGF